jgi:hypothetical protein
MQRPAGWLPSTRAAPVPSWLARPGRRSVAEVDGSTGTGPVNTVRVTLQPMEAQILRI